MLVGHFGHDRLFGGVGNDRLIGGAGNDCLAGGAGHDVLTGRSGSDIFVFDVRPARGNVDRITDFNVVQDVIVLDASVFAALPTDSTGHLAAGALTRGNSASGPGACVIYNVAGGVLYDADGSGSGAAVQFASLAKGLALSADDFMLI
jgi:Ca2+-binding RTX toxin-like protein